MSIDLYIFDSWFGFVYEIGFYVSDFLYGLLFSNIGGIVLVYFICVFWGALVRGVFTGSTIGAEGFTDYQDRLHKNEYFYKVIFGSVLVVFFMLPIDVNVKYTSNRLIPPEIINITFDSLSKDKTTLVAGSESDNTTKAHTIPTALALPISVIDAIFFGRLEGDFSNVIDSEGKTKIPDVKMNGVMSYLFGDYFGYYMRNPQDVVWSYMEFYLHGLSIGDLKNMIIAAPSKITSLYTITLPNLLKAFNQSADSGNFIIEKGGGSSTLKASLDQILYLAFMGYPEILDQLSITYNPPSGKDGKPTLNKSGIDTLVKFIEANNLIDRDFSQPNVKPTMLERGAQWAGIAEGTKLNAIRLSSLPVYLKRVNENEAWISKGATRDLESSKKIISESMIGLVYPIFFFTPLSNLDTLERTLTNVGYRTPDISGTTPLNELNCDDIANYFFCELPKVVYNLTTKTKWISKKILQVRNFFGEDLKTNEELNMDNLFGTNSILYYIRHNSDQYKADDKDIVARKIKNTVNTAYTLLDQYMLNAGLYTSMSKNLPVDNTNLFYQVWLNEFYGSDGKNTYINKLVSRFSNIMGLRQAMEPEAGTENISNEIAMADALASFYSELLNSYQTVASMFIGAVSGDEYDNPESQASINNRLIGYTRDLYLNTGIGRIQKTEDINIYNNAKTSNDLPSFINFFNAADTWFSDHSTANVVAKLITGILDLFIFIIVLMAWFTFLYFFLMRALQCVIFFIVWPVHIFKSLIKGDFQFLKILFVNWLGFRFYDFVVCLGFMFSMIFIEVLKVMQVESSTKLVSTAMQAIFIKGMLAIFIFLTLQIIRMLYTQIVKIIETKDQMFANSLNRVADSMVASTQMVGSLLGMGVAGAKSAISLARLKGGGGGNIPGTPEVPKGGGMRGEAGDSIKDALDNSGSPGGGTGGGSSGSPGGGNNMSGSGNN